MTHADSPLQAGDSAIIVGEIAGDALRNLESQLSEVYGRHIAERTDWGSVDDEFKAELEAELKRASASIAETRRGLVGGLDLTHLDASVDLDELLKASMQRAKTKKLPLEPDQMAILQSACLGERWRCSVVHAASPLAAFSSVLCARAPFTTALVAFPPPRALQTCSRRGRRRSSATSAR